MLKKNSIKKLEDKVEKITLKAKKKERGEKERGEGGSEKEKGRQMKIMSENTRETDDQSMRSTI